MHIIYLILRKLLSHFFLNLFPLRLCCTLMHIFNLYRLYWVANVGVNFQFLFQSFSILFFPVSFVCLLLVKFFLMGFKFSLDFKDGLGIFTNVMVSVINFMRLQTPSHEIVHFHHKEQFVFYFCELFQQSRLIFLFQKFNIFPSQFLKHVFDMLKKRQILKWHFFLFCF